MPKKFIILTNVASPIWQRAIGAYQIASHCRSLGITCQVIDFTNLFRINELEHIFDSCIDNSTLALGISTTFFYNTDTQERFISAKRDFNQVLPDNIRDLIIKIKQKLWIRFFK